MKFFNFSKKYTKEKKVENAFDLKFTVDESGDVSPSLINLGNNFYFKPRRGLNIHITYYEFVDYLFDNYSEFIDADLLDSYRKDILYDDTKMLTFKMLHSRYLKSPQDFKMPVALVYYLKVEADSCFKLSGYSPYCGPSEAEMCLLSKAKVLDESGREISLKDVTKSYSTMFLEKYGDVYADVVQKNPITNLYHYKCLCWLLDECKDSVDLSFSFYNNYKCLQPSEPVLCDDDFDDSFENVVEPKSTISDKYSYVKMFIKYKFQGNDEFAWACCYHLIEQGEDFRLYLKSENMSSYVLGRLTAIHDVYQIPSCVFFNYPENSSQMILEELFDNGYNVSTLNPSVVKAEDLYMIPICMEMHAPFMELYKRFGKFTLQAVCALKCGFTKKILYSDKFSSEEWNVLLDRGSSIVYGQSKSFYDLLDMYREENVTNYKRGNLGQTNDLFITKLKTIV